MHEESRSPVAGRRSVPASNETLADSVILAIEAHASAAAGGRGEGGRGGGSCLHGSIVVAVTSPAK